MNRTDAANRAKRCTARCTTPDRRGTRCKNPAMVGLDVCRKHGGATPAAKQKSGMAKMAREYGSVLGPIPESDPESRGDISLAVSIRKAVSWIRFCEAQLARLGVSAPGDGRYDGDALADVLGGLQLASRETVSGIEREEATDLTTERYAAGVNVWEERLRWWTLHLRELTKQWIAAGFEARRLELHERTITAFERAQDAILRDCGVNPRSPEIRKIVARRVAEIADSGNSEGRGV